MMKNSKFPLLLLEFDESTSQGSRYRISDPEDPSAVQKIFIDNRDYSITFCESPSSLNNYLQENKKWLRSILYTTLRIKNPAGIKIPITFPCDTDETSIPAECIKIYCDGSCDENGNGGWGVVIIDLNNKEHEFSGSEKGSTSNRVELMAAVEGIKHSLELNKNRTPLLLLPDSMYVINGITHRLQVWLRNGFITALGKAVVNQDLWMELAEIIEKSDIHCRWVESGNDKYNRRCDLLAKNQSRSLKKELFPANT